MVMINVKLTGPPWIRGPTDRAHPILSGQHRVKLLDGYAMKPERIGARTALLVYGVSASPSAMSSVPAILAIACIAARCSPVHLESLKGLPLAAL